MTPHAFIAMPFGTKPGADGMPIDFNRVFDELLKPALQDAGFDVFRADQEQRAGDIRFDMFQELLVADLVVADLTLDNPNVWYELGVRHALRACGVMLVQGPRHRLVPPGEAAQPRGAAGDGLSHLVLLSNKIRGASAGWIRAVAIFDERLAG